VFIDKRKHCLHCNKVLTSRRRRHDVLAGKFCSMAHQLRFLEQKGVAVETLAARAPAEARPQGCATVEEWLAAGGRVHREADPALVARGIA
jgi:hypothetical protein